ncbi:DUF3833 domain-containing protein [Ferrigenium sp. UT5]|uniref:DUF3833 domain-containing protein n=1 Tax=Ferrigenium sp. UT5 TaxID=3242105 RepID=UPI0035533F67
MKWRNFVALLLGALMLSACKTTDMAQYAKEKPVLDMQQYFKGTVDAWGMFQNRKGEIVKRFNVVIRCSWQGDVGTLDEDFRYSDGTQQKRVWTLKKQPNGQYIGTAPDVVGEAVGIVSGNALNWNYVLALPVDGKVYNVNFDDWMILMDDTVMLNRAVMSKFGFKLGEVTLSFRKRP